MKNIYPRCPACGTLTMRSCLSNLKTGKAISFHCRKCKNEYYQVKDMGLMTHKEYIQAKNDFNG